MERLLVHINTVSSLQKSLLFYFYNNLLLSSSAFFFSSIVAFPRILCVSLGLEGSNATRLINNYRVHKTGGGKKTICWPFDVRHERDQNYKGEEVYKEERKLAHSSFNSQLLLFPFFIASFLLFLCHLSHCLCFFI